MDVRREESGLLMRDDPAELYRAEKAKRAPYMRMRQARPKVRTRGDSKKSRLYCPRCQCNVVTVGRDPVLKGKRVTKRVTCTDCLHTWYSCAQEALGGTRLVELLAGSIK